MLDLALAISQAEVTESDAPPIKSAGTPVPHPVGPVAPRERAQRAGLAAERPREAAADSAVDTSSDAALAWQLQQDEHAFAAVCATLSCSDVKRSS